MQSDMVCRAVFATLAAIFSRQEKNDGKHLFSVIYPQHPTLAYICARSMYRPRLDADVLVEGLIHGIYGSRSWMAAQMGRVGGSSVSPAKAAAARRNGAKGGRPRNVA